MPCSELFIGLMSGTSLDGVDGVLADFATDPPTVRAHLHRPFPTALRTELTQLCKPGSNEIERAGAAGLALARDYGVVIDALLAAARLSAAEVRAVGIHGQTVRHRPEVGFTVQLNAPAAVAEAVGIDVVADFRSRDLAAGGEGAPLVPAFHAAVFRAAQARTVVNIGGFANLTGVPAAGHEAPVVGFDCGPGNALLDAWAQQHLGKPIDRDGCWAASGQTDEDLLADFLADPYFERVPPKSTGRERFNPDWLAQRLIGRVRRPEDVQATLAQLTAHSIAAAIQTYFPPACEVLVCGGGAFNRDLMERLARACHPRPLQSTAALGLDPQWIEPLAFAWLARAHLARRPGNLPAVTGAQGPRVLGALYPAG